MAAVRRSTSPSADRIAPLRRGVDASRANDRKAIVASIELGYSYDQIALMLGKPSAEAARLAVRRALLRLGEEMTRGA